MIEIQALVFRNPLINLNTNSLHKIGFRTRRNTDIFWITGIPCIRDGPLRNFIYFHCIPAYDFFYTHLWYSDSLLIKQPVSYVFLWSATHYLPCIWNHKLMSMCWSSRLLLCSQLLRIRWLIHYFKYPAISEYTNKN